MGLAGFDVDDPGVPVDQAALFLLGDEESGSAPEPPSESSVRLSVWRRRSVFGFGISLAALGVCGGSRLLGLDGEAFRPQESEGFQSSQELLELPVPKVRITETMPFRITIDGKAFGGGEGRSIRGLAGLRYYDQAKKSGADAMRTWSLGWQLDNAILQANEQDIKVSAGIDLPRDAYMYDDVDFDIKPTLANGWKAGSGNRCSFDDPRWLEIWKNAEKDIRKYRSNPHILWWTVGNELESFVGWSAGNDCLWNRVEWFAKKIKAMDWAHPVGTVIAGFHPDKVKNIKKLCPSLDFIGVNAYGNDAHGLGPLLQSAGWHKPYVITEYGVPGNWISPQTPWEANVEPLSSTSKRPWFRDTYDQCLADKQCLGSFAFFWGWKWEKTGTWFGGWNEWAPAGGSYGHGYQNDIFFDLFKDWSSNWTMPELHVKEVRVLTEAGYEVPLLGFSAERGAVVQVDITAPGFADKPSNKVVWIVTEETTSKLNGNIPENTLEPIRAAVTSCAESDEGNHPQLGLKALVNTALLTPGAYHLYGFVRDIKNGEPLGCQDSVAGDECWQAVGWAKSTGINMNPEWYPNLTAQSSYRDFHILLGGNRDHGCSKPCDKKGLTNEVSVSVAFRVCDKFPCDPCFTVKPPDPCFFEVQSRMMQAKETGTLGWPLSGITANSSFLEFQSMMHRNGLGQCPQPCSIEVPANMQGACSQTHYK